MIFAFSWMISGAISAADVQIVQPSNGAIFTKGQTVTVVTDLYSELTSTQNILLTIDGVSETLEVELPYEFDLTELSSGKHTISVQVVGTEDVETIEVEIVDEEDWREIPGIFGAEDYYDEHGTDIDYTLDYGWNRVMTQIDDDDWVRYMVDIEAAGNYELVLRASSNHNGSLVNVWLNDNIIHTVTVNKTSGWLGWESISSELQLPAGQHELRFTFEGESSHIMELNWIEFHEIAQSVADLHLVIEGLPDAAWSNDVNLQVLAYDEIAGTTSGDGIDSVLVTLEREDVLLYTHTEHINTYDFTLHTADMGNGAATLTVTAYGQSGIQVISLPVVISNHYDCHGDLNGTAYLDDCKICVGGNTGLTTNDLDFDGVADCLDLCPNDPEKTAPGSCGCGVPDWDGDNDGVPNCDDVCAGGDDSKDNDQDGIPDDCDTDDDNDGISDHNDCFPFDPQYSERTKWYEDLDGDGKGDVRYVLGCEPPGENWVLETGDECPYDPDRSVAGACGCGAPLEGCIGYVANVGEIDQSDDKAMIYPNPASAFATVSWTGHRITAIDLFDVSGKAIQTNLNTKINLIELPTGYYLVRVTDDNYNTQRVPLLHQ